METVVGAAIIAAVLFGLAEIGRFSFRAVADASFRLRASFLAEEGVEIIRLLRDTSWSGQILPLQPSRSYHPVFAGGAWTLSTTDEHFADSVFDRTVRLYDVYRDDVTQDIKTTATSSGSTLDSTTREVHVTVSWSNRGSTSTVEVATYFTDLFGN